MTRLLLHAFSWCLILAAPTFAQDPGDGPDRPGDAAVPADEAEETGEAEPGEDLEPGIYADENRNQSLPIRVSNIRIEARVPGSVEIAAPLEIVDARNVVLSGLVLTAPQGFALQALRSQVKATLSIQGEFEKEMDESRC